MLLRAPAASARARSKPTVPGPKLLAHSQELCHRTDRMENILLGSAWLTVLMGIFSRWHRPVLDAGRRAWPLSSECVAVVNLSHSFLLNLEISSLEFNELWPRGPGEMIALKRRFLASWEMDGQLLGRGQHPQQEHYHNARDLRYETQSWRVPISLSGSILRCGLLSLNTTGSTSNSFNLQTFTFSDRPFRQSSSINRLTINISQ